MTQQVINFSEAGLKHIKNSITANNGLGFRLSVRKTGCSGYAYVTDVINKINEQDIQFSISDVLVCIDENSVQYLQGTVVDFIDHGMGQTKLVFHNPNAANLCGCGESFNLLED